MERHLSSTLLSRRSPQHDNQSDPELLLDLAMDALDMGSWRVDLATGKCWWSRRVYEIHNVPYSSEPVDLNQAIKHYHPADAKTVAWLVMKAVEEKKGYSFILRLQLPHGELRLVQSVASVKLAQNGEVSQIYGLFRDVTDKFSNRDISSARSKLVKAIIRNSPTPIVVLDRNYKYLEVSPAWADFHELGASTELPGKSHLELFPNLPDDWRQAFDRVFSGEVVHRDKVRSRTGNQTLESGAVLFPWHVTKGEVGGAIVMYVSGSGLANADQTLEQIANLMA